MSSSCLRNGGGDFIIFNNCNIRLGDLHGIWPSNSADDWKTFDRGVIFVIENGDGSNSGLDSVKCKSKGLHFCAQDRLTAFTATWSDKGHNICYIAAHLDFRSADSHIC